MKPKILLTFIQIYFCGMALHTHFGLAQRRFVEWLETLAVS
jgi:hypothetical protein